MKILMWAESFGSNLDTFINNEIKYLSKSHQIKCICNKHIDEFPIRDIKEIKIDRSSIIQKIYFKLYKHDIYLTLRNNKFSKEINKIINEFKPDIIHCHFAYEALMLLENIKDFSIPIIVHFHGYGASQCLVRKSYVRKIRFYLKKKSIYPIYVSDYMKSDLDALNIPTNKGIKLYYGIDLNKFKPNYEKKLKPFTFLQVSTLVEKKGIRYTLEAFSEFLKDKIQSDFNLILTGDNPLELKELKELAKELNIEKSVTFFGKANQNHVIELLNQANAFLHHCITIKNDKEGIPNAIMEAMAMKLPVLCTEHAGIPELVENGVNGFLIQERNIEEYVKRLNEITEWKPLDSNRKVIEDKFNLLKHNKKLEKFYLNIIKN